jgi:hypothetical protein
MMMRIPMLIADHAITLATISPADLPMRNPNRELGWSWSRHASECMTASASSENQLLPRREWP